MATAEDSELPSPSQLFRSVFCSPARNKRMIQSDVFRALGTVEIMVGVVNVGLGPQRMDSYPYWLGILFLISGSGSVLADMCPLPCLVGFSVVLNILGSIFSIVAVVLYALHLANFSVLWMCSLSYGHNSDANCTYLAFLAQRLLTGTDITLIISAVLQLCVSISLAVLGIRFLCSRREEDGVRDEEIQQPLLKEVLMDHGPER